MLDRDPSGHLLITVVKFAEALEHRFLEMDDLSLVVVGYVHVLHIHIPTSVSELRISLEHLISHSITLLFILFLPRSVHVSEVLLPSQG